MGCTTWRDKNRLLDMAYPLQPLEEAIQRIRDEAEKGRAVASYRESRSALAKLRRIKLHVDANQNPEKIINDEIDKITEEVNGERVKLRQYLREEAVLQIDHEIDNNPAIWKGCKVKNCPLCTSG